MSIFISFEDLTLYAFPFNVPTAKRSFLMMTGAYFDESESDGCFSIAGYLGDYNTWMHLDWLWESALKKWGMEYFKASECSNGIEIFAKFRDDPAHPQKRLKEHEKQKLREVMTDFVDAVCKVHDELHGIGAVIIVKDFNRIVKENKRARGLFTSNPYYLAMQLSLVAASIPVREMRERTKTSDGWVKPIFDSHKEYSKHTLPMFERFSLKNPKSAKVLMQPIHEDDKVFRPLQVADLIAYEATKLLAGQLANRRERISMTRLMPGVRQFYRCDYDTLKMLLEVQTADSISVEPAIKDGVLNSQYEANEEGKTTR